LQHLNAMLKEEFFNRGSTKSVMIRMDMNIVTDLCHLRVRQMPG
jgi:hypothetical protein